MGAVTDESAPGILIAVDGGGTKTDAVALDLDGNVLARVRGAGSAFDPGRAESSVRIVDQVITDVHREAGSLPLIRANVYLSGLDTEPEILAFREGISNTWWASGESAEIGVDNDMFALLRAGTERPDAVAVVCGTGINCVGVRSDGLHARFLAWGTVTGDWGGGSALGEQAVWHAARALDGRGPQTSLTTSIPDALGVQDLVAVMEGIHFGRIPTRCYATLAPLVLAAALVGDGPAGVIVDRQATEIVDLAVSALTRLGLNDEPVPVVLGGGIIASGNARLLDGIRDELARRAPRAYVKIVHSRPILGAALLTLEAVGATEPALARAREQLERPEATASLGAGGRQVSHAIDRAEEVPEWTS
ncbi:MAG TPA: BadF/BadG/BcrA/BcrD ATPase family protein [Leifsonia sp.]